jgi:hypothetical protein
VILPKDRDPRFVTIRRGGTLTESDHQLPALWAALCAEHVLGLFESAQPEDQRPRQAIDEARAWVRGEITMSQARTAAGHANAAARDLSGAARHAAYAAGQAAAVAHVAAHELGAAAYAIKAARAAAPEGEGESAGRLECRWQRDQLPEAIRELGGLQLVGPSGPRSSGDFDPRPRIELRQVAPIRPEADRPLLAGDHAVTRHPPDQTTKGLLDASGAAAMRSWSNRTASGLVRVASRSSRHWRQRTRSASPPDRQMAHIRTRCRNRVMSVPPSIEGAAARLSNAAAQANQPVHLGSTPEPT